MLRNFGIGIVSAASLGLLLAGISLAGPSTDTDGDGVFDVVDNCRTLANAPPLDCDSDLDGYGNGCDGDLDNNFFVSAVDFNTKFVPAFKKGASGITDMDCNGVTNAVDFNSKFVPQFKSGKPGPSGMFCAGTIPCDL